MHGALNGSHTAVQGHPFIAVIWELLSRHPGVLTCAKAALLLPLRPCTAVTTQPKLMSCRCAPAASLRPEGLLSFASTCLRLGSAPKP